MDFLKRHYEKLILLVLLLAFIGSMMYVLQIIKSTGEVTEKDLAIPTREADYKAKDVKDEAFQISQLLQRLQLHWEASTARDKRNESFSDLVVPFAMAKCPYCERLLPLTAFGDKKKCPFSTCGKDLPKPPERKAGDEFNVVEGDEDGDGIRDVDEQKYGLNSKDPYDARYDKDRDGFSNVYEITNKFNPSNSRHHPPLWHRLYLKDLAKIKLPIKFMAVNTNNSTEPAKWDIQLNDINTGRSSFSSLDGLVTLDKKEYKIVKIDLIQQKIPGAKQDESERIKDESVIYLEQQGGPDKLSMWVGQDVFSSDIKAIFADTGEIDKEGNPREFICGLGERFTMGNRRIGRETYVLNSIDQKKKQALLVPPGKDVPAKEEDRAYVTKEGRIPANMRIIPEQEQQTMEGMEEMPPEGAPGGRVRR